MNLCLVQTQWGYAAGYAAEASIKSSNAVVNVNEDIEDECG